MSNIPIFCLVGKTGAGKSTYLNALLKDDRLVNDGFRELIYHTTRNKRYPDEQGYHFVPFKEFDKTKHAVIESRVYSKYDDDSGKLTQVAYYTTWSDILDIPKDTKAFICAASVDQGLSYLEKLSNVYFINITADPAIRLNRLLNRVRLEDGTCPKFEVQEISRRMDEEIEEYSRLYENDKVTDEIMLDVNNTDGSIEGNIDKIISFIYDKVF